MTTKKTSKKAAKTAADEKPDKAKSSDPKIKTAGGAKTSENVKSKSAGAAKKTDGEKIKKTSGKTSAENIGKKSAAAGTAARPTQKRPAAPKSGEVSPKTPEPKTAPESPEKTSGKTPAPTPPKTAEKIISKEQKTVDATDKTAAAAGRPATPKKSPATAVHTEKTPAKPRKTAETEVLKSAAKPAEKPAVAAETPPPAEKPAAPKPAEIPPKRPVSINEFETVKSIAAKFGTGPAEIIKKAFALGRIVTINQKIDRTLAEVIGADYNCEIKFAAIGAETEEEEKISGDTPRAPIVTVMGHVDHGKTTLLDAIRHSDVAASEHGGITQHIGAYRVRTPKGDVAFLDTPGHEAFTALRARGSKVTDIVVLVVSAADGVMPQTVEAINHARAAGVPIVVAINKIDVAGANPDKIKSELNQHNLAPEEWGGNVLMREISARNKINIDGLIEAIHLVAEMMELKCDPKAPATGAVIESRMDPRKGPCVTLMVRNGTLRTGDVFVAGTASGKVRAMFDEKGARVDAAGPSTPVMALGASELPAPGDKFRAVKNERDARDAVERLKLSMKEAAAKTGGRQMWGMGDLDKKDERVLRLLLKADVAGSLEAVRDHIERIEHPEFSIVIVHSGVGPVSESDINLARTTGASIIGFNVKADAANQSLADRAGVEIRTYRIVYELFDDIKKALEGLLEPKLQETVAGRAQVRKKFEVTKVGTVAGSYVAEGKILRGAKARLIRDGAIVYDGRVASLRRVKDDVSSVEKGFECGIVLDNFKDIKEGDVIESYTVEKVKRLL